MVMIFLNELRDQSIRLYESYVAVCMDARGDKKKKV